MMSTNRSTILCLTSEIKGLRFIEEAKRQGCYVILLTREKWKDAPDWPRDSIDEMFFMPTLDNRQHMTNAVSYLARSHQIDHINPLDDLDVEMAAALREHLRLQGMGETATRFFRDKLAMRMRAREAGILVPEFTPTFSHARLSDFMNRVSPPWVLKPRSLAGSMGIKKCNSAAEVWQWLDQLGDEQSHFHLEQFVPGDVFHVDALVWDGEVIFSIAHQYGQPPLTVSHGGGIFTTRTMRRDAPDTQALLAINRETIKALGMVRGANHIEFIKAHANGRLYFLEAAARVGGANISELIEFATGLNLWGEWAKIEVANVRGEQYQLTPPRDDYAGILICLAKQESPDLSVYAAPEVVWRMQRPYHAGLIVQSPDAARVESLIADYTPRFMQDFMAVLPALDKPPQ
jgi:biotin carboxylase